MKYCVQCGEECVDNAEYCPECGHPNFAPEFVQYCAACDTACELLTKRCPECNCRDFYYGLEGKNKVEEEQAQEAALEKELAEFEIEGGVLVKYTGEKPYIKIPQGVVEIGKMAFNYNKTLLGVIVPDGVRKIDDAAFIHCEAMVSITLPESLTEIGNSTFANCKTLIRAVIPEGVVQIGAYAFENCSNLEEVVLPRSLQNIAYSAFNGCRDLKQIVIPSSVENIGVLAFHGCDKLTIYAEAPKKPDGWYVKKGFLGIGVARDKFGVAVCWNSNRPVVWGYIAPPKTYATEEPLLETEIAYKATLCSPFPGFLKNRLVEVGTYVSNKQPVVILEALKMDNDLNAPCDGKIHFLVEEYTRVETDQVIAVIE